MRVVPFLALVAALLVCSSAIAKCERELINGWGIEWIPYAMGTQANPSGFDLEILAAIVAASGCTLTHTKTELPWARRLYSIENGLIDLTAGASISQERQKWAYFTDGYRGEFISVYIRKSDFEKYSKMTIDEIIASDFIMGGEDGNVYGEKMEGYLNRMGSNRVQKLIRNEQNMGKLIRGRIDGYIGFLPAEDLLIREQGYADEIVMLPAFLINTGSIHIMLSKKNNSPEILQAMNKGLAKIRKNGVYDVIVKKYSDRYQITAW